MPPEGKSSRGRARAAKSTTSAWGTQGGREAIARRGRPRDRGLPRLRAGLLEVDLRAGLGQLLLELLGVLLREAGLDRLRGAVDEVLRLLEAQARGRLDDLDDLDLLLAGALEDDVVGRLLLRRGRRGRAAAPAAAGRRHDGRSRRGDAPAGLAGLHQLRGLPQRKAVEGLEDRLERRVEGIRIGHGRRSWNEREIGKNRTRGQLAAAGAPPPPSANPLASIRACITRASDAPGAASTEATPRADPQTAPAIIARSVCLSGMAAG